MMNNEEIISLYESVADITEQMLAAARSNDWEHLTALESHCASHARTLEKCEPVAALSGPMRVRKLTIIQKILANDREIRDITEPWMADLARLMKSSQTERKLNMAYGTEAG